MARIAGVNLPKDKRIEVALTAIFGIGRNVSLTILENTKIGKDTKVKDLQENEIEMLRQAVDKLATEGDLKRQIALNIKRKKEIGCYVGRRHSVGLPCRGQRTRQNARTKKGKKKTVANKKMAVK